MRNGIDYQARKHFIYYIYGADGACLYIGCSSNPEQRWRQHRGLHPGLANLATSFRKRGPYRRFVALKLETEAIRAEQPFFNLKSVSYSPERHAEIDRINAAARAEQSA